ncbi:DUF3419 family protein [Aquisalimonas asiatica]|uniref:S-adenosylmethionine-diacylglycerol 3-amino-3-carboxypropyl transferase n=1 Tax=Aquisalimonas asiatica TaxID=406100 RepID=A0A1H8Q2D4_9GAMM|nr:DUF3419 family protein [Aquisalimonas asiatica]SEO48067.1 S-adenosylmethionine-diacylglycerol 3-amino-3-carboxypropyl transferase [Aquisalimonas asiatica]
MRSEIGQHADFSTIRYAQCWEDADVLLGGLDIQPGQHCLSIASAGDNTLSMLSRGPERVIALDLNPAQLACLELRVAAYRELDYDELLVFMGSRPGDDRDALYRRCRPALSADSRQFWDQNGSAIRQGIGSAGRFERYLAQFRRRILPLIHPRRRVDALLEPRDADAREHFHDRHWDNWRWRLLFRLFFSRPVMGRLGRDPAFFRYIQGSVSSHLLRRTRHALTVLDPSSNPYLHWILTGTHGQALPHALRPGNVAAIRDNLHRLEWHRSSLEGFLPTLDRGTLHACNLSDVFEYMSPASQTSLLEQLVHASAPGARLAYWNMLVPRTRPENLADRLDPRKELADQLHEQDKAFFYSRFVVESVI